MTSSSLYRGYFWYMKGNREYTRLGYEAAAARFDPKDLDVDCTERHVMITGGNQGLGLCTALQLARRGCVLHLVCRDMDQATAARAQIVTDTGNDKIHLHHLDLSVPRNVIKFCEDFHASHDRLHVLINNAGCMKHERQRDGDGIDYNFAVNTLAVHLLTVGLMPLLQSCEDGRVVMVSSAGMLTVRLDPVDLAFEKMKPYNGTLAYSQNKRQQVVLALSCAQSFAKVQFSSMHPGWVDTQALRTALPEFYKTMKAKLRTVEQGADTIVWLAISGKARTYNSGLFFQDRESVSTHLPLAWTRSTMTEESMFIEKLNIIVDMLIAPPVLQDPNSTAIQESHPSAENLKNQEHSLQTMSETTEEQDGEVSVMPQNSNNSLTNTTKEERGEGGLGNKEEIVEEGLGNREKGGEGGLGNKEEIVEEGLGNREERGEGGLGNKEEIVEEGLGNREERGEGSLGNKEEIVEEGLGNKEERREGSLGNKEEIVEEGLGNKEERKEDGPEEETTPDDSNDVKLPEPAVDLSSSDPAQSSAGIDDAIPKINGHHQEVVSDNLSADVPASEEEKEVVLTKSVEDAELSSITTKVESSKAEESSKESTVS